MIKGQILRSSLTDNELIDNILTREDSFTKEDLTHLNELYLTSFGQCPFSKNTHYEELKKLYSTYSNLIKKKCFKSFSTSFCCYCGREATDLDHFHPQKKIPQFAISPNNLIPSCTPCNRSKSERYPISKLQLFHPYLDKIYLTHQTLFCFSWKSIEKNYDGEILFEIEMIPVDGLSVVEKARVVNTLNKIKGIKNVKERVVSRLNVIFNTTDFNSRDVEYWYSFFLNYKKTSIENYLLVDYFACDLLSQLSALSMIIDLSRNKPTQT